MGNFYIDYVVFIAFILDFSLTLSLEDRKPFSFLYLGYFIIPFESKHKFLPKKFFTPSRSLSYPLKYHAMSQKVLLLLHRTSTSAAAPR